MTSLYKILGTTDQIVVCDCCGREDLKCTVKLSGPNGVVYYGRGCAAKALGWTVSADRVEKLINGTAKVAYQTLERAWRTYIQPLANHLDLAPAVVTVDGATVEVWDANYGRLPAGEWVRESKNTRLYWRVAA